jgi:hypothetical protein
MSRAESYECFACSVVKLSLCDFRDQETTIPHKLNVHIRSWHFVQNNMGNGQFADGWSNKQTAMKGISDCYRE